MATKNEPDPDLEATVEIIDAALPHHADDLPPIDFSTFIVSLRTSAMLHLGSRGDGQRSDKSIDLALARQEIDLLGILELKTRGNLTGDEERLLSQILFDLRTRYVAVRDRERTQ